MAVVAIMELQMHPEAQVAVELVLVPLVETVQRERQIQEVVAVLGIIILSQAEQAVLALL